MSDWPNGTTEPKALKVFDPAMPRSRNQWREVPVVPLARAEAAEKERDERPENFHRANCTRCREPYWRQKGSHGTYCAFCRWDERAELLTRAEAAESQLREAQKQLANAEGEIDWVVVDHRALDGPGIARLDLAREHIARARSALSPHPGDSGGENG